MKSFHLAPGMITLGGVFYPTGYMVLMYPSEQDARDAVRRLDDDGLDGDEVALASPQAFEQELLQAVDDEDSLPSAGTEGDTARQLLRLARQGHYALIVHAPTAQQSAHLMDVLRGTPIAYGQKYRRLVIEDLE